MPSRINTKPKLSQWPGNPGGHRRHQHGRTWYGHQAGAGRGRGGGRHAIGKRATGGRTNLIGSSSGVPGGRQGDPGTAQFMVSLEDQLLEGLGAGRQLELKRLGQRGGQKNWNVYAPLFRLAQKRIERRHYRQRLDLKNFDKQRDQEMLKDIGADPYVD